MTAARDPRPPWELEPLGDWYDRAACTHLGSDLFFRPDLEQLAVRYCHACPVRRECASWAVEVGGKSLAGVWGGLTEADREQVRRQRRAEAS